MNKNKSFRYESQPQYQQIPLLEFRKNGWQVSQHCGRSSLINQPLSTQEVMKMIALESPINLYRARQQNSVYWHNSRDISQSKIVVPLGMRNKWMVFVPQNT